MPVLAYLLTFGTYAARLHGDQRGSWHHSAGFVAPNEALRASRAARARGAVVSLDETDREIVLAELRRTCSYRGWMLGAAHVRTEHVHLVVSAFDTPESVLFRELKAWTSRRLREQGRHVATPRVWARGGNAVRLWDEEALEQALRYVLEQQGAPMSWCTT